ncbi:rhomboid family intramembrane serine protease [Candidatus Roizmanbacteria bacterium]|nr:MAG: rhomboid family intramembrane serine protease [Candidatus Roizmanbacteria bacterium]
MFPLYDSSPQKSFPFVNYLIIAANLLVFFLQISASSFDGFILQYGFIPQEFSLLNPAAYFYVFSSMFMHGGLLHIGSNLWFLHIFGDNVEDELGHLKYLVFYLAAGVAATLAQYFTDPASTIPLIGASGAISGVTGAYFILFRQARIRTLVTTGFYIRTVDLPASFFLGVWFFIQLLSGFTTYGAGEGGVAWFAHIGGFVFGWVAAMLLGKKSSE